MNTYLIPGLGGDKRMYEGQLKRFPDTQVLEFIEPLKNESINAYAKRLAEKIDTTKPFILLGVSLGGILTQEIAKIYPPHKSIIISSVKTRKEMPVWMRIFKYFPINRILPGKLYLWMFFLLVRIKALSTKGNPVLANLRNMAKDANPIFVSWAVNEIISWENPIENFQPYRIHGNRDFLFPLRRCKEVDLVIDKGTHAMILTHVCEINEALEKEISFS